MNARERLLETFRLGSPDRPFRWECVAYWGETLERWRSEGMVGHPDGIFEMDRQISPLSFHGEIRIASGFTSTPYIPEFETKIISEDDNCRVVRDTNGIVRREFKHGKGISIPKWIEFPVKTKEDYEALRPRLDPDDPRRFPQDWPTVAGKYRDRDYPIAMPLCGFFGHLRNMLGPAQVSHHMYRNPGMVRRMLKDWTDFDMRILTRVSEGLDLDYVMVWEDMCFKTGPLISPALFRKFLLPCYSKLSSHARKRGIPNVMVDTDGNVAALLPLFVEGGVNGMVPFEVQAGNDIAEIAEKYPKLMMIGGINKLALTKGRSRIDLELESKVPAVLERGGYVPSLDHAAPPDIPFDNFRYYMKRVREIEARFAS